MDPFTVLKYLDDPKLLVVILVSISAILFYLLRLEIKKHHKIRNRLDDVYSRIETRLYHELDELEKLLREERMRSK